MIGYLSAQRREVIDHLGRVEFELLRGQQAYLPSL